MSAPSTARIAAAAPLPVGPGEAPPAPSPRDTTPLRESAPVLHGDPERWAAAAAYIGELPIYQRLHGADRAGAIDFRDLASVPILDRATLVRQFPTGWMTKTLDDATREQHVEYATSSGTSGERVQLVRPKNWWLGEHRRGYRHVPGLKGWAVGEEKSAVLTTMDCSAAVCFADHPRYEDRTVGSTLYLNTTHDPNQWGRRDVERILDELGTFAPKVLEADPVFLTLLLEKRRALGVTTPVYQPEVLKLTYELVTRAARRFIRRWLDVSTVVIHGTTELGWLYHETPTGYARCPELSVIEYLPFCQARNTYEIVVTSVKNEFMPFVRFRIGDVVKLRPGAERAPAVESFCGRVRDAVPGAKGQLVTPGELDEVLGALSNEILIYQAEVATGRRVRFRYVTEGGAPLSVAAERDVRDRLVTTFGDVEVAMGHERQLCPERSGKFMVLGPEKSS